MPLSHQPARSPALRGDPCSSPDLNRNGSASLITDTPAGVPPSQPAEGGPHRHFPAPQHSPVPRHPGFWAQALRDSVPGSCSGHPLHLFSPESTFYLLLKRSSQSTDPVLPSPRWGLTPADIFPHDLAWRSAPCTHLLARDYVRPCSPRTVVFTCLRASAPDHPPLKASSLLSLPKYTYLSPLEQPQVSLAGGVSFRSICILPQI